VGRILKDSFAKDLALGAKAKADNVRGASPRLAATQTVDDDPQTYWATDDEITTGVLELDLGTERSFDVVMLRECIKLGQRVSRFRVEAEVDGAWVQVCEGTTIGYKRLLRIPVVKKTRRVRVHILAAEACPTLSTIGLYRSP